MFHLDKFFKEKTLREKLIYLIGIILIFLSGWLSKHFPFSDIFSSIVEKISSLWLAVLVLFLFLLWLATILYYSSQVSQKPKPKIIRKTFHVLVPSSIEVILKFKNPEVYEELDSIDIIAQSIPRYICRACQKEILYEKDKWQCQCRSTHSDEINIALYNARQELRKYLARYYQL